MTRPDGNVIPPTGKAFDLEFAQTSRWTATADHHLRVLGHGATGQAARTRGVTADAALLQPTLALGPGRLAASDSVRGGRRRSLESDQARTESLVSDLERNKKLSSILPDGVRGEPEKAIADHFGGRYIQHNRRCRRA